MYYLCTVKQKSIQHNNTKQTAMEKHISQNEVKYPIYDNGQLHVSISKGNIKVGNIPQFNTLPGDSLFRMSNGQTLTNIVGTCGGCCKDCVKDCYAVRSLMFHHNSVCKAWGGNTVILRYAPDKVRSEIKEYCMKNIVKYFRFHTSGEIENEGQLKLYCDICDDNPDVTFYIYTKRFDIICDLFVRHAVRIVPENLVINLSEWNNNIEDYVNSIYGQDEREKVREFLNTLNVFAYDDGEHQTSAPIHCPAIDRKGHETGVTCAMCRRCMTKGMRTSVYAH